MNNFVMLIASVLTLLVLFLRAEAGDEALLLVGGGICVLAFIMAVVGIVLDKDFFE